MNNSETGAHRRQQQVLDDYRRHLQKIFSEYPELEENHGNIQAVRRQIVQLTVERIRGADNEEEIASCQKRLDSLRGEQARLLKKQGLSPEDMEPRWVCSVCQDTGRVATENGYVDCSCNAAGTKTFRRRAAGLPSRMQQAEFSNVNFTLYPEKLRPKAKRAFNYVQEFCNQLIAKPNGQGLFIHGETGAGKSYMLGCVANYMAEHMSVKYLVYADFLDELRATFGSWDKDENEHQMIEMVRNVDLLLLDDLGVERPTEFALRSLAQIVDYRYRNKLPLLVTSNFTLEELRERTKSDLYGERIVWRLIETCTAMQLEGNIRLTL